MSEVSQVKCYSGYIYAQRPCFFTWQGKEYKVQIVEKEWQEPGERHFLVRTEDNNLFELWYNEQRGEWKLKKEPE